MGIVMVQPTAGMPPFGVIYKAAHGHVVTATLIAMFAMLFTAISYGRMARLYPAAGSAYTYVSREVHPLAGFATGWVMLLDYVVNPLVCTVWCASATHEFVPALSYPLLVVFYAVLFTAPGILGIEASARANKIFSGILGVGIVWVLAACAQYVLTGGRWRTVDLLRPFYDPATFSWAALSGGSAVAVLTFIGFDGVSTLSEEARDARRDILPAIVLTCLIVGLLSALQVYGAQLVWPAAEPFPNQDTAYLHAVARAGGSALQLALSFALLVAFFGAGSGTQLAGARLLYGMGRDGSLPAFFARLHPRARVPRNNVLLIGAVSLAGATWIDFSTGAELLNFGALTGFLGVNASALRRAWADRNSRSALSLLPPAIGLLICFYLWVHLSRIAWFAGCAWLLLGAVYVGLRGRGAARAAGP